MKKSLTALLLFQLLFFQINAQTSPFNSESIKVSKSEIEATTYDKDSTANALIIYEYGKSWVSNHTYDLMTQEKRKIKILTKEGFDNATVSIYLYKQNYNTSESVDDIAATTYNIVDGKVIKTPLLRKNIYTEAYNEKYDIVKFTLPNIKEGSVITYSYTLKSPFMFKYHGWEFQHDIPTLYSEYNTSIPGNWEYHIKLVGSKKLTTNTSKVVSDCLTASGGSANCAVNVYAMKDIPAFIEEDYMTFKDNYLARIEYELKTFRGMDGRVEDYSKTWEDVDKEFRTEKNIGKQLKKTIDLEEILPATISNEADQLKKAKAIYNFVKEHYTWNGEYNIFNDVSVKDLIKNKSGNVSSINILLHNLLRESGINVNPVLLSTRNNGFATTIFPVVTDFNYLLVEAQINNKAYLLDATDYYLSFGQIPFRCLNRYARRMDFENGSEWMDISSSTKSSILTAVTLEFDAAQNLVGDVKSRTTGYHALMSRMSYFPNPTEYEEKLQNKSINIEISNHQTNGSTATSPNFSESYDIAYNAENVGKTIYLNPFLFPYFKENPFKLQERTYPIDFGYEDKYTYMFQLNLGDNYTIVEKPEDMRTALPNRAGDFSFSTTIVGNTVNMMLNINFNEAVYPPEYYPYLKEFMNKVVNMQTNSLFVIKKKS
ncbi:MAG: DUF3857 domain-containing protein [Jejuia sp.]